MRRVVKSAAALSVLAVLLLSFGGWQIAASMEASSLDRPAPLAAIVLVPILAAATFLWAALHDKREAAIAMMAYLVVVAAPFASIALLRS